MDNTLGKAKIEALGVAYQSSRSNENSAYTTNVLSYFYDDLTIQITIESQNSDKNELYTIKINGCLRMIDTFV